MPYKNKKPSTPLIEKESKFKADYTEMINEPLDHFPITKDEEFVLVVEALQNLINKPSLLKSCFFFFFHSPASEESEEKLPLPLEKLSALSQKAKDQLVYIQYMFKTPKEFVNSPKDYNKYQAILSERISVKIKEFQSLEGRQNHMKLLEERYQESMRFTIRSPLTITPIIRP